MRSNEDMQSRIVHVRPRKPLHGKPCMHDGETSVGVRFAYCEQCGAVRENDDGSRKPGAWHTCDRCSLDGR